MLGLILSIGYKNAPSEIPGSRVQDMIIRMNIKQEVLKVFFL
jgi:hypothetical protein